MASTFTANAKLAKPALNDTGWGSTIDGDLDAIDALSPVGWLVVTPHEVPSSSLNVSVAGGSFKQAGGTYFAYAGTSSFTLPASSTAYLWLTDAGVLTTGTAWPSVAYVPLAIVTVGATAISSVADARITLHSGGVASSGAYLPTTGGTMTGPITLAADPTANLQPATKQYVDAVATSATSANTNASGRVSKAGDTMTGLLVLSGVPTATNGAATKGYVDTAVAGVSGGSGSGLPTTGGTMTGAIVTAGVQAHMLTMTGTAGGIIYTAQATDDVILCDAGSAAVQIALPSSPAAGQILRIKRMDGSSNFVTITSSPAGIEGSPSVGLSTQYQSKTLVYDAISSKWVVF